MLQVVSLGSISQNNTDRFSDSSRFWVEGSGVSYPLTAPCGLAFDMAIMITRYFEQHHSIWLKLWREYTQDSLTFSRFKSFWIVISVIKVLPTSFFVYNNTGKPCCIEYYTHYDNILHINTIARRDTIKALKDLPLEPLCVWVCLKLKYKLYGIKSNRT